MRYEDRVVAARVQLAVGFVADANILDLLSALRGVLRQGEELLFGEQRLRERRRQEKHKRQREAGETDRHVELPLGDTARRWCHARARAATAARDSPPARRPARCA